MLSVDMNWNVFGRMQYRVCLASVFVIWMKLIWHPHLLISSLLGRLSTHCSELCCGYYVWCFTCSLLLRCNLNIQRLCQTLINGLTIFNLKRQQLFSNIHQWLHPSACNIPNIWWCPLKADISRTRHFYLEVGGRFLHHSSNEIEIA